MNVVENEPAVTEPVVFTSDEISRLGVAVEEILAGKVNQKSVPFVSGTWALIRLITLKQQSIKRRPLNLATKVELNVIRSFLIG